MIDLLKTVWSRYRTLAWWKQLLLLLPLIAVAAICIVLFFIKVNPDGNIAAHVKYHQEQVDNHIKKNQEAQDKLEKQEKIVSGQQKRIMGQIARNQKKAGEIVNNIDKAVKNNDLAELERLRKKINEM
jgi:predicted transcriptional regulator